MTLTKFESDLFRLSFLEGSFYHLHQEFPKIKEGDTFFSFKSLVREIAIIKLHTFLKVRTSLLEDLIILKKEAIDESLHPLIQPILNQKEGIRLLRNKYLAHMQEENQPFEKTVEEIIYETKLSTSWYDITFYCGCALNYCKFFKANFQKDFESTREKYFKSMPLEAMLPQFDIKHVQDPDLELLNAIDESIKNLKKNKLEYQVPEPKSWSFTYTESYKDDSQKST